MLNRAAITELVEDKRFQNTIIALIVINAVILALQAIPSANAAAGPLLYFADNLILIVFVVEIAMRIFAHGRDFVRDPWNLFDFSIVAVSFLSVSGPFGAQGVSCISCATVIVGRAAFARGRSRVI